MHILLVFLVALLTELLFPRGGGAEPSPTNPALPS